MPLQDIHLAVILPIVAIQLILIVIALTDLTRREPTAVRGAKFLWVFVIVLGNLLGSIVYFVIGRRNDA
jgi:uncharacterized membrane protein YozB (DUF420 family)